MGDVYVLGTDMIKFGKFSDRSVPQIGAEAALLALDDAGLTINDMEALYCGNLMQSNAMVGQRVLQQIGMTGIPVVNCANACATGATAFREGWTAIKAGLYDLVLCVGVEQMAGAGLLPHVAAGITMLLALVLLALSLGSPGAAAGWADLAVAIAAAIIVARLMPRQPFPATRNAARR